MIALLLLMQTYFQNGQNFYSVSYFVTGTVDQDGRPIVLCYAECISRAGLNKYEMARLLLYYATIPK